MYKKMRYTTEISTPKDNPAQVYESLWARKLHFNEEGYAFRVESVKAQKELFLWKGQELLFHDVVFRIIKTPRWARKRW